jgi:Thylakoid formation protein
LLIHPPSIIRRSAQINYKPGAADSDFARRYKHLVGAKVKTVGEAFAEFTQLLGFSVNPLYKSMVTDIVGTTHLIVVNARFQRDPVWSLGILSALDLLLKNYPEPDVAAKIVASLFQSVGLNEAEVRAEAKMLEDWAKAATKEDVELALAGEGGSPLAKIAASIKAEKFWMYSRYFGLGLLRIMEDIGLEMDKDDLYPVMEAWMTDKLGKSHLTACVRHKHCWLELVGTASVAPCLTL